MALGETTTATARRRAIVLALTAFLGLTPIPPCDAATEEIPIRIVGIDHRIDARQIGDYPTAVDAIVGVLVHKLSLPVPPYTMEIYFTREEFEVGLIKHLGLKPKLARSTASFAKAAVGGERILINELAVAELSWPERIELLAHELAHTVQSELAGNRPFERFHWLTEGFAEWIAYAVTQALGLDDMGHQRARITAALRAAGGAGALPSLTQMNTFTQFIETRRKYGYAATFSLAFLIADFLMERHSRDAVVEYFKQFKGSSDYARNFAAAFGENLDAFDAALQRHLARLLNRVSGQAASPATPAGARLP